MNETIGVRAFLKGENIPVECCFGARIHCKGGGGGGSGGKIDYPDYVRVAHNDWVDGTGVDTMASSVVDLMNAAIGSSPFTAATAFDPDTYLGAALLEVSNYTGMVPTLASGLETALNALVVFDVTEEVEAFSDHLDAQLEATVYPRFEAGMRDIGAVMSSAFAIGRANIEEGRNREVARYSSQLRLQLQTKRSMSPTDVIQATQLWVAARETAARLAIEHNRIEIVARKEQVDKDIELDEADAKWDLEMYAYGGNLLAAPSGGVIPPTPAAKSSLSSALGGALSGAAAGAMLGAPTGIGAPIGAAIGGAIGIGAALLQ